jgi:hypothetical protein
MSIVESLDYTIKSLESLSKIHKLLNDNNVTLTTELDNKYTSLTELKEEKEYYSIAVDKIYEESIGSLKNTLDTALQYIFHDRNYSSELTLEDKRGTKTLDISLRDLDNDPDMLLDIKDDQGQGVAAVVSAILKTYLLINKNTRILLLDEKYSNVSQEYINRFFDFLRKMCEEKSFILVMVTHDDRMTPYADKVFQVNNGNVLLIKDKDD